MAYVHSLLEIFLLRGVRTPLVLFWFVLFLLFFEFEDVVEEVLGVLFEFCCGWVLCLVDDGEELLDD